MLIGVVSYPSEVSVYYSPSRLFKNNFVMKNVYEFFFLNMSILTFGDYFQLTVKDNFPQISFISVFGLNLNGKRLLHHPV